MNSVFVAILCTFVAVVSGVDCRSSPTLKRNDTTAIAANVVEDTGLSICTKNNVFNNNDTTIGMRGKISVITRLSSWQLSLRQASVLGKLEARFRDAGYKNIQFIIINANLNHQHNHTQTHSNETASTQIANNITIVNSSSDSVLYSKFDLLSAYVFDQCERLTYIIYSPWSSIQRPYVKASILSTIYDAPCGDCDVSVLL